jgi:hypothetical protein
MAERRKLIEVALPLEAINRESAREKSIRHGHPSTLHLWSARRPLAACRAVLFASIVDDPSSRPDEFPTEEDQERERQRLFALIEELVKWENTKSSRLKRDRSGAAERIEDLRQMPVGCFANLLLSSPDNRFVTGAGIEVPDTAERLVAHPLSVVPHILREAS